MFIVPLSSLEAIGSVQREGPEQQKPIATYVPFQDILQESIASLGEAQTLAKQDAYDLAVGDVSDLHTVSIHSAMQQTALEATVQLASRAVSAYKEIMQMQL